MTTALQLGALRREEVHELLVGRIGFLTRDLDPGGRFGYCFGSMMKIAMGSASELEYHLLLG